MSEENVNRYSRIIRCYLSKRNLLQPRISRTKFTSDETKMEWFFLLATTAPLHIHCLYSSSTVQCPWPGSPLINWSVLSLTGTWEITEQ